MTGLYQRLAGGSARSPPSLAHPHVSGDSDQSLIFPLQGKEERWKNRIKYAETRNHSPFPPSYINANVTCVPFGDRSAERLLVELLVLASNLGPRYFPYYLSLREKERAKQELSLQQGAPRDFQHADHGTGLAVERTLSRWVSTHLLRLCALLGGRPASLLLCPLTPLCTSCRWYLTLPVQARDATHLSPSTDKIRLGSPENDLILG